MGDLGEQFSSALWNITSMPLAADDCEILNDVNVDLFDDSHNKKELNADVHGTLAVSSCAPTATRDCQEGEYWSSFESSNQQHTGEQTLDFSQPSTSNSGILVAAVTDQANYYTDVFSGGFISHNVQASAPIPEGFTIQSQSEEPQSALQNTYYPQNPPRDTLNLALHEPDNFSSVCMDSTGPGLLSDRPQRLIIPQLLKLPGVRRRSMTYEWEPQDDPDLEKKRRRAMKAYSNRQKDSQQKRDVQMQIIAREAEISQLKEEINVLDQRAELLRSKLQEKGCDYF